VHESEGVCVHRSERVHEGECVCAQR
jgi:hypothetical protein